MTEEELLLLLYLETRAVDHGGLVNSAHMSDADRNIVERWNRDGFVLFGRVCAADARRLSAGRQVRHDAWCKLSDRAFQAAHEERRSRAERLWGTRPWKTTAET